MKYYFTDEDYYKGVLKKRILLITGIVLFILLLFTIFNLYVAKNVSDPIYFPKKIVEQVDFEDYQVEDFYPYLK